MRSGRPRGLGKPFEKVGDETPHLLKGFPVPPGLAISPKLIIPGPGRVLFFKLVSEITVLKAPHAVDGKGMVVSNQTAPREPPGLEWYSRDV